MLKFIKIIKVHGFTAYYQNKIKLLFIKFKIIIIVIL